MARNVHCRSLGRAHWYGELATALTEAERLLSKLNTDGSDRAETGRLCHRIAAVRSEVEALNRMTLSENRIVGIPWSEPRPIEGGSR
jgi:hypothetical protein